MSDAAGTVETIKVHCACGKSLRAPLTAVGKKAKCPKCGNVMTITAPPPAPANEDGLDGLYALADDATNAEKRLASGPACPGCGGEIDGAAVLCVNCGMNLKTGQRIAAAAAVAAPPPPPKAPGRVPFGGMPVGKKKVVDKLAPQRSIWLGLAGCFAGGLLGGIVWFAVAYFSGYELYFLAILVGAATGVGMQIGQQGYSTLGGIISAGATFITILLAKIAVVAAVLLPVMTGTSNEILGVDLRLLDEITGQELAAMGVDPVDATEEQSEKAGERAERKIRAMSKEEREARVRQIEDTETKEHLSSLVTDEILAARNIDYDSAGEDQIAAAATAAAAKVDAMSPEQRKSELERLETVQREKFAAAMKKFEEEMKSERQASPDGAQADGAGATMSRSAQVGFLALLLVTLFGWKSAIFTIVAMLLAYRTASGSVSG